MNVLITSAARKVSLVRAFQAATSGRVIAADVSPVAAALFVADEGVVVPRSDDPAFVPAILELAASRGVRLVVPTRDEELPVLARARDELARAGVVVMVSSPEAVELCQDKLAFTRFCIARGFPVARTFDGVSPAPADFPLFFRPRRGKGGAGATRVDRRAELRALLAASPDGVVQELVDAPELTIDVLLSFEGEPISAVARERVQVAHGESIVGRTVRHPVIEALAIDVSRAIGLVGHVTVQCFARADGPALVEVNPRYGGGATLGFAAGVPTPELVVRLAAGERVAPRLGVQRAGVVMMRHATDFFLDETALHGRVTRRAGVALAG